MKTGSGAKCAGVQISTEEALKHTVPDTSGHSEGCFVDKKSIKKTHKQKTNRCCTGRGELLQLWNVEDHYVGCAAKRAWLVGELGDTPNTPKVRGWQNIQQLFENFMFNKDFWSLLQVYMIIIGKFCHIM